MNLQQLYYFNALVEKKNYTKAAKSLFIAQSSLSHSISALEKELGIPLFERDGNKISLTDYGQIFLKYSTVICSEMDTMWTEIKQKKAFRSGVISIDTGPFNGVNTITKYAAEIIENFQKDPENTDIRFIIQEHLGMVTSNLLLQGQIDFGFNVLFPNEEFDSFPIIKEEMVLIVPPMHPLSSRKFVELWEICRYPFITYCQDCATRYILMKYFESANCQPRLTAEVINERLIMSMVSANQGISIIPYLPGAISDYNIKAIPIKNPEMFRTQEIFWVKNRTHSPAADRFIHFIKEFAGETQTIRMPEKPPA